MQPASSNIRIVLLLLNSHLKLYYMITKASNVFVQILPVSDSTDAENNVPRRPRRLIKEGKDEFERRVFRNVTEIRLKVIEEARSSMLSFK